MDTLIVAKVLGIYLLVSGLFLLFRGKTLPLVLKDMIKHRSVMWLAGFMLIMIGGLIAYGTRDSLFITVIGWVILVKGALYILAPELFTSFFLKISRPLLTSSGIVIILLGLYLFGIW